MNGRYEIGERVLGNWTLTRLIGQGSYGKVYEAQREDFGVTYKAAIKIITIPQSKSEIISARSEGMSNDDVTAYFRNAVEQIVQEFALMSQLKGTANIVSYEDHAVLPHEGEIGWDVIIRMELLTPLLNHVMEHTMTTDDVIKLGTDMCKALELCKQRNIVHRDIKPENIFISPLGDYKLGDFGIARTVEKTTGGLSKKGTYTYMAPEVYKEEPYNSSVDIYSLGIVLYRFLNDNRTPFLPAPPAAITYRDREDAQAKRLSGTAIPAPRNANEALSHVILKACAYRSEDRYSEPSEMRRDLEALRGTGSEQPIVSVQKVIPAATDRTTNEFSDAPANVPKRKQNPAAERTAENTAVDMTVNAAVTSDRAGNVASPKEGASKKHILPLAIAGIVALVLIVGGIAFFAGRGGNSRPVTTGESGGAGEQGIGAATLDADGEENDEDPLPVLGETFDSMLWGRYSIDDWEVDEEGNYTYNNDLSNFMKSMKYETLHISDAMEYELSVVPYCIQKAVPYFAYNHIGTEFLYDEGTRSYWEQAYTEFLELYDEKYWENFVTLLNTDIMQLDFCDKLGNTPNLIMAAPYQVDGNKLYWYYGFSVDEETFELTYGDYLEFEFTFDGRNLILRRDGCTVEMAPMEFSAYSVEKEHGPHLSGYVANDSQACNGIAHISYSKPSEMTYVYFTDGNYAIDPVIEVGEDTITISWEKAYRTYNGYTIESDEPTTITGQYICNDGCGFILIVDGTYYLYQSTSYQYDESKLADVLDQSVNISELSESQVDDLIATQTSILNDLDEAFEEAGISANIDSSTGKVTMDSSILFAVDDATLSDTGKAYLDGFLDVYSSVIMSDQYSDAVGSILVEGHTDTDGSYDYNMTLSEQRAQSVVDYCLERQPALASIIEAKGCSYDDPVLDDNGNVDKDASRRVVFKFILNVQ